MPGELNGELQPYDTIYRRLLQELYSSLTPPTVPWALPQQYAGGVCPDQCVGLTNLRTELQAVSPWLFTTGHGEGQHFRKMRSLETCLCSQLMHGAVLKLFQPGTVPKMLPSLSKSRTINYRRAWTRRWDVRNHRCFWKHLIHVQDLLLFSTSLYLRTEHVRMSSASPSVQAVWIWRPLSFHLNNCYFSLNLIHVHLTGGIQAAGYKPASQEILSPGSCRILPAGMGSSSLQNSVGGKSHLGYTA